MRMAGINLDVTAEIEAEIERNAMIERLQQEQDLRERFLCMISHDLRTPLSAILMGAQMISRKHDDPNAIAKLAKTIADNSVRMDGMIQDLLDTNRLKAGKPLLIKVSECKIKEIVEKTLSDLRIIHGNRFILIADGEVSGRWDCDSLRRVVENLVNNAVKYGAPNAPITLTLHSSHDSVRLCVNNRGEPIPEGEVAHLFNQFTRSVRAEKTGELGWGIV